MIRFLFYTLTFLLALCYSPAYSCSMSMTGASALVIQSIMKEVQAENKNPDREITAIKKAHLKDQSYWTFIVETSVNGGDCQAVGYAVFIDPGCKVKVDRLKTHFSCQ